VSTDPGPHPFASVYVAAIVTVEINGTWMTAPEAVATVGQDLHVITAWNPGPRRLSLDENQQRNMALRARLEPIASPLYRALGSDPASTYAEESWAVGGLSDAAAVGVARDFDQVAIFRLTSSEQIVLGCENDWTVSRHYSS